MAASDQVTVDKSYFDALLRRADFHTAAPLLGRPDPASVTISKAQYDALLRESREFQLLKNALFNGGITQETLTVLINGTANAEAAAVSPVDSWADDFDDHPTPHQHHNVPNAPSQLPYSIPQWRSGVSAPFNNKLDGAPQRPPLQYDTAPGSRRHVSCGQPPSSLLPDTTFDDEADSFMDEGNQMDVIANNPGVALRTLYFTGFPSRTTYRDLLSVIKGGKILSINMRSEKGATVTFHDGAAEYLAWVKRNDIYLHSKRVEVRWAERQFRLNGHINTKVLNGASRNLVIRAAHFKGFTKDRIRDDLEHIHNLVVIDVVFRSGDVYVYINSVHNALFARTCMMSRSSYKGCKIDFFPDECDVPLPVRESAARVPLRDSSLPKVPFTNRFGMLHMDDAGNDSEEENRTPVKAKYNDDFDDDDDEAIGFTSRHGVSLQFLDDDDSVA